MVEAISHYGDYLAAQGGKFKRQFLIRPHNFLGSRNGRWMEYRESALDNASEPALDKAYDGYVDKYAADPFSCAC